MSVLPKLANPDRVCIDNYPTTFKVATRAWQDKVNPAPMADFLTTRTAGHEACDVNTKSGRLLEPIAYLETHRSEEPFYESKFDQHVAKTQSAIYQQRFALKCVRMMNPTPAVAHEVFPLEFLHLPVVDPVWAKPSVVADDELPTAVPSTADDELPSAMPSPVDKEC